MTQHCTIDDIGLAVTGNDAGPIVAALNKYLYSFSPPIVDGMRVRCRCGRILDGSFGRTKSELLADGGDKRRAIQSSFTVRGRMYCEACTWPVRAHHWPKADGVAIFESVLPVLLLYHPDVVEEYCRDS